MSTQRRANLQIMDAQNDNPFNEYPGLHVRLEAPPVRRSRDFDDLREEYPDVNINMRRQNRPRYSFTDTPELLALRDAVIDYPDVQIRPEYRPPEENLQRDFPEVEFTNNREETARFRNQNRDRQNMEAMQDLRETYPDTLFFDN